MAENDDLAIDTAIADAPVVEPSEQVESPTTTEPAAEPVPDADEEVRKQIAEHAFKRREAEREAKALQQRLRDLEQQQNRQERPVVPPLVDPLTLDEQGYQASIKQRDEAVRRAAEWDLQQRLNQSQLQAVEAERNRLQQEALTKSVDEYSKRAVQLGMKPEELAQVGGIVSKFGIDDNLVQMILDDEQGPLITKYLGQNIQELDRLARLPPMQAAVQIMTTIKQKAATLKPKISTAPEPVTSVRSAALSADYGPPGATYE